MVPYVNTAEEARKAVAAMRVSAAGSSGGGALSFAPRHLDRSSMLTLQKANSKLLTILQIETGEAVEHVEEIAAVDGVDVLFIGPLDLTVNLGFRDRWIIPTFALR